MPLPAGARVAGRWDGDKDAFTGYAEHVDAGGGPQPRRDGAVAAAVRLHRLERALTSYAVQRAYDDPLVMAEHRLTGEAFVGDVTLADPQRVDDTGKRPVLRPRIQVVTTEPVLMPVGATLWSPARPAQKARVVFVTPGADGKTEVVLELSGGMGRGLTAPPGTRAGGGGAALLHHPVGRASCRRGTSPRRRRPRGRTAARPPPAPRAAAHQRGRAGPPRGDDGDPAEESGLRSLPAGRQPSPS